MHKQIENFKTKIKDLEKDLNDKIQVNINRLNNIIKNLNIIIVEKELIIKNLNNKISEMKKEHQYKIQKLIEEIINKIDEKYQKILKDSFNNLNKEVNTKIENKEQDFQELFKKNLIKFENMK